MSDNEVRSETALPWPTAKPMRCTVRHITRGRLRTTVITNLNIFFNLLFFFFFWPLMAWGMLVPRPGIESGPSAVKAPSPNHWTTKEFPVTPSCWSISYAGEEDQKEELLERPNERPGTSLVVQWLRVCLAMQGMLVRSLAGGLRSHTLGSN